MADKSNITKRREFVKQYINERTKNGEKLQGVIYELAERFICDTRTIENWFYHKDKEPRNSATKNKY